MSRQRVPGDGPKCACGKSAVWGGYCQMADGIGYCNARPPVAGALVLCAGGCGTAAHPDGDLCRPCLKGANIVNRNAIRKLKADREEIRQALIAYNETIGFEHTVYYEAGEECDCPQDDTCSCPWFDAINEAMKP